MQESETLESATSKEVTWVQVDLDAIAHNVRELKARIGERVQLMAVVKANAYGHGAVPAARCAVQAGASHLAVARVVEGIELREGGIAAPILVMSYALPCDAPTLVERRLTPTVNTLELARALSSETLRRGVAPIPVHVKVDTGMGRLGLLPDEVLGLVRALAGLPGLELEALYTHFSVADEADKSYTYQQHQLFVDVLARLSESGFQVGLAHEANSAATLDMPATHLQMVRCGIALYGMRPSSEVEPAIPLRPAMSLHSRVARVRTLPADSSISYGRTFVTNRLTRVALVPLGYGEGYHRLLSNRGSVLIRGRRCPILGRVCMDQFVVDVGAVRDVALDDEVVALGRQGSEEISAEEIAELAETISYEVTTSILPRVSRLYLQGGRVVEVHGLLNQ
jgi:alanine racemase